MLFATLILLLTALTTAIPLSIIPQPPTQHYHLSAYRISSDPNSAITVPNLCVIPSTTTSTRYIGISHNCQKHAWTLDNGTLSTTTSSKHHSHLRSFSSLPIITTSLTSAGQFLAMHETPLDPKGTSGGLDVRSVSRDGDGSAESAGGMLEATNTGGEYENWWLCSMPDGSKGCALVYGFHHGYEGELGARQCERYQLRLTPVVAVAVERVYAVPVDLKPAAAREGKDADEKEGGLRRFGTAGQCSSLGFGLACWAQQKFISMWWERSDL